MLTTFWSLVLLGPLIPYGAALPKVPRSTSITAFFQPYQLYQCNLGTFPFQAPTTLVDGVCNTFSPSTTDPPYLQGYQGFMANLTDPGQAQSEGKTCTLVFFEKNACGLLGQTTNEVNVPTDGSACKPITLDLLGTLISNGARSVLMSCA